MYSLIQSEIIEWASSYDGPLFHGLLTDPPYHLTTITKRFGKKGSAPAKPGKDGAFSRISKGFLGQSWDGGDIAFRPDTWSALLNLLHPGAFGFAFAASRNWHRLAVAIEDAGAIIHPSMFGWVQGQGLPKATQIKDPRFKNHRFGGQIMKPSLEPIIVFQRPYQHKPQINIVGTGAGALNVEDTRLNGRWPANFYVDLEGAKRLDSQSGVKSSGMMRAGTQRSTDGGFSGDWPDEATKRDTYADRGGLSRFFYMVKDQLDEADPVFYAPKVKGFEKEAGLTHREPVVIDDGRKTPIDNGFQRGKTLRYNPHPTLKPLSLCRYLASLLLPPDEYAPRRILVPFAGVASEMIGAVKAGWEEVVRVELGEEYASVGKDRLAYWVGRADQKEKDAGQLSLF